MGILSWIFLGIVAGALAKFLMPGRDKGGLIRTMILGIAGAFFGGWVGSFFDIGSTGDLSLESVLTATAGAFLILLLYRKIKG